jgi:hypothetical protein
MVSLTRNQVRNWLGTFLIAYGGLAFLCFAILVELWVLATPTTPDPRHGFVFPHNEHGHITYFTAFQATCSAMLFATSIPLVFVGVAILPKKNVVVRRGFLGASANWDDDDPRGRQLSGYVAGALAMPLIVFVLGPILVGWMNARGVICSLG